MSQLTSLQTKVAGQILSAIQSGDLQPGTHLKEVELTPLADPQRAVVPGAAAVDRTPAATGLSGAIADGQRACAAGQ